MSVSWFLASWENFEIKNWYLCSSSEILEQFFVQKPFVLSIVTTLFLFSDIV